MKKYSFLFILFTGFCISSKAQVKIGGTPGAPDISSVLELDGGTNKGLLLPRMTKQNMMDIQNPATGLAIFATDEQAIYVRLAGSWEKQAPFTLPYYGLYNYELASTFKIENNSPTGTAISGITTAGVGIDGQSNTGIGGFFNANANGRALITGLGRVGIGTYSPTAILHIDGTNQTGNTLTIVDDQDPFILLQKAGIAKGFLQTLGDDFKLGTVLTNPTGSFIVRTGNADRLFLDNTGLLGIGNPADGARLYVDATNTSSTAMIVNDQNPTIQLQNSGVNKGSLQLNGDDLRIGVNQENANGNIVFRINGADRINIDNAGDMTIGSIANKDASLSTFAANDAVNTKANIDLQSNYGSTHGPNIKFTGRSPATTQLGSITNFSDFMEFRSGVGTARGFRFKTNDKEVIRVSSNGNMGVTTRLGVGTISPAALLHIDGYNNGNYTEGEIVRIQGFNPIMQFMNVTSNVGFIQAAGGNLTIGTNINTVGDVILRTAGADRVFLKNNGKFFIGGDLTFSSEFTLAAKGKIAGSEFVVKTVASWPDYVFAEGYKLKSLEVTEAFIKANKHLPNIPSAAEIEKNGLELGDMQKRMMEKIEELTLYLIEANKEIQILKKQMEERK
jgi:hypothetical protein